MTREEAIRQLNTWSMSGCAVPVVAIQMAIEALQWQDRILTQIEDIVLKEHGERREEIEVEE